MAAETVEFHAESGWGKSVLMRHLSCHLPGELAADGLVFMLSLDDMGPAPGATDKHLPTWFRTAFSWQRRRRAPYGAEGEAIPLLGLPEEAALARLERELRRLASHPPAQVDQPMQLTCGQLWNRSPSSRGTQHRFEPERGVIPGASSAGGRQMDWDAWR